MDWKKIFEPTVGKIVLFLILTGISTYLIFIQNASTDMPIKLVGLPLKFLPVGTFGTGTPVEFSVVNFIINLIFWYTISVLIVELYNKYKK